MRRKMITDSWYSTIEYVDSWKRCVNRSKLERLKYNGWWKKHVKWLLNLSFTVNMVRTFRNYQLCVYFSLTYVKTCGICWNICLTRKLKFDDRWQIFAFLTYFGKLLRRSQSFAQRNFYTNLETILRQFNRQKLNPFEVSHMVKIN